MKKILLTFGGSLALFALAVMPARAGELITNGGFEDPVLNTGQWEIRDSITGWSATQKIEIQDHAAGDPFEGDNLVELDPNSSTEISQEFSVKKGNGYKLTYAWSPRPGKLDNHVGVYLDGVEVGDHSASGVGNGDTVWTKGEYTWVAESDEEIILSFKELGASDSFGMYLDAVSVYELQTPMQTGYNENKGDDYAMPHYPDKNELTCTGDVTNINGVSVHWMAVGEGDNQIKYQRQYRVGTSGGWGCNEIYADPYTNYRTFGGGAGTEGIYGSRIRAWKDTDGDNAIDTGEVVSDWSNECSITFDRTAPTMPVMNGFLDPDLSCGAVTSAHLVTVDWTDSTDANLAGYEYFIDYPKTDGTRGEWLAFFKNSQYRGSLNEGIHYIKIRARDEAGNLSEWSDECSITADWTAPEKVTGMTIWQDGEPIGCGATVEERNITVKWDASDDPNISHYEYQADADMQAPFDYNTEVNGTQRTGDIRDEDGTYHYRVRAVDEAGNVGEYSDWCHVNLDRDGDGIFGGDMCSGTEAENFENLNPNHFVWIDQGIDFLKGVNEKAKGKAKGPDKSFSLEDTHGCGCSQIIEWLGEEYPEEYGEMLGQEKFGCSIGTMEAFVELTGEEE